jgi:hypothetical protein
MHRIPPLRESLGGLFIGVVRGPVIMFECPPNYPFTLSVQSFNTSN